MHDDGAFGRRLRQLRRASDLTQEALAQAAFCALDTIKKLEAGQRRPSRQMAAQLADVLRLDAAARAEFLAVARAVAAPDGADEPTRLHAAQAPPAAIARRPLPRQVTPFIGRARELADLRARLGDPGLRLITLVAPGGMGKTRLAIAAAEQCRDGAMFPDGVAFAALTPLSDPASIEATLADTLGLSLAVGGERPARDQLLDYLREKVLLLVLDNCEHLREAIAELARTILAESPGVTLLATSRERLGLRVEQMLPLDGMVNEVDGALLFAATARMTQPAFALDETTRPQVAAICTRVGGMPLAIELAAGWADTLSLAEIAAELGRGDEILTSQASDLAPRHRGVRAVCDATWARLSTAEQTTFAQVAVFRGGGTRRALQAVTGATLGQLQALVGKALLYYDPERERYSVHELLRQYAHERLRDDAAAEAGAQGRHAAYYLRSLAAREADLKGADQREALEQIGRDIENAHAAWGWAAVHGALDLLAEAVGCLSLADEWLGRSDDGLSAMQAAAAAVAVGPTHASALYATLLSAQARFVFLHGDASSAIGLLQQAQAVLDADSDQSSADAATQAQVLVQLGHCTSIQDYAAAHDAYTRCLALFESLGDQWGTATALTGLGSITIGLLSNVDEAMPFLEQSVARYRALGDQIGLIKTLTILSSAACLLTRVTEAVVLAREAYALAQASGNLLSIAQAGSNLGAALFWDGNNEESYAVQRATLAITQELGHRADLPLIYYFLGNALLFLGRYAEARAAYTSGLEVARLVGDRMETCENISGLCGVALVAGAAQDALRLAEEQLAYSVQLGQEFHHSMSLAFIALAARHLGDTTKACVNTLASLQIGLQARIPVHFGLLVLGLLQVDRDALEAATCALWLAEQTHYMNSVWMEDIAVRELRASTTTLPPDVLAAAQARWVHHDYWDSVTELLAELEADGWGAGA